MRRAARFPSSGKPKRGRCGRQIAVSRSGNSGNSSASTERRNRRLSPVHVRKGNVGGRCRKSGSPSPQPSPAGRGGTHVPLKLHLVLRIKELGILHPFLHTKGLQKRERTLPALWTHTVREFHAFQVCMSTEEPKTRAVRMEDFFVARRLHPHMPFPLT